MGNRIPVNDPRAWPDLGDKCGELEFGIDPSRRAGSFWMPKEKKWALVGVKQYPSRVSNPEKLPHSTQSWRNTMPFSESTQYQISLCHLGFGYGMRLTTWDADRPIPKYVYWIGACNWQNLVATKTPFVLHPLSDRILFGRHYKMEEY